MRRTPGGIAGGLTLAGTLVVLVGLGVVAVRMLHLPGYWTPVVVGLVLLTAGIVLQAK